MLLAFSAKAEELDILALSLTFGNVDVQKYAISSFPIHPAFCSQTLFSCPHHSISTSKKTG
jgi:hypothetical protein